MTNPTEVLRALDEDEKGLGKIYTPGGPQNLRIVSESGMYALTMRSNKPQAKRWGLTRITSGAPLMRTKLILPNWQGFVACPL